MKIKLLKNILSILLISSMLLTLFSCDTNKPTETEKATETEKITETETKKKPAYYYYDDVLDYSIINVDNGCRLVFDDSTIYENVGSTTQVGIDFESIEEFYNDLVNGTLKNYEKLNIYENFQKDEIGTIIFDPNNLYIPVVPTDCKLYESLIWSGNRYRYGFEVPYKYPDNWPVSTHFLCFTEDRYKKELKYQKNLYSNDQKSVEIIDGKEVITFLNGDKLTGYTVENENKQMYVMEYLYVNGAPAYYEVTAFYISNGFYYEVIIYGIMDSVTPEWLFEFDVEKFVPNQNS